VSVERITDSDGRRWSCCGPLPAGDFNAEDFGCLPGWGSEPDCTASTAAIRRRIERARASSIGDEAALIAVLAGIARILAKRIGPRTGWIVPDGDLAQLVVDRFGPEAARYVADAFERLSGVSIAVPGEAIVSPTWGLSDSRLAGLLEQRVRALAVEWGPSLQAQIAERVARRTAEGATADEILAEIRAGTSLAPDRAASIARDLANGMLNDVVLSLAEQVTGAGEDPPSVRWVNRGDERVRAGHRNVADTTLGVDFDVAGYPARGPHDPRLPADLRIGCRCRAVVSWHP
jgi:hypothetical protein